MFKRCWLLIVGLLLLSCMNANAIDLKFTGFVADQAGVLSNQSVNDINMMLWDLQKKTGADIAVVTLNSLNGRDVNDVAVQIGREYKLGDKVKNNGVVFLTSVDDRKMSIQLGTGLEKTLGVPAIEKIRDTDILPYYRKSQYENGIFRGAYSLARAVAATENVSVKTYGNVPPKPSTSDKEEKLPWWAWPFILLGGFFKGRGRFNSGSFGGFGGGGSFGGSGCSGSW